MANAYESSETLARFHQFHMDYYEYGRLDQRSKTRSDFIKGLVRLEKSLPGVSGRKICDVGYGNGFFLALARQRGWQVDGIDTSRENQRLSYERFSLNLRAGEFLTDVPDVPDFDVVSFWDVVEHLPDPHPVLQKAVRILKPSGRVVVAVPNDRSFLRYLSVALYRLSLKRMRVGLDKAYFLEHPVYYSRRPLEALFNRNGFVLEDYYYTSTDLAKYTLPRHEKMMAWLTLFLGRVLCLENRLVAVFRKSGDT